MQRAAKHKHLTIRIGNILIKQEPEIKTNPNLIIAPNDDILVSKRGHRLKIAKKFSPTLLSTIPD
jgi:hypothetical protein